MAIFQYITRKGQNRRSFLCSLAVLSGCGGGGGSSPTPLPQQETVQPTPAHTEPPADPRLVKLGAQAKDGCETSLFVLNGELLAITFQRPLTDAGPQNFSLRVRRWTGEILAEHPWVGRMGCVVVKNGTVHVFGTMQSGGVAHSTLAADFTPSTPTMILTGREYANVDVTEDANGFRMVLETAPKIYFASSPDLDSWTIDGGEFNAGNYTGCPSIHYYAGTHYLTYLATASGGRWETKVASSSDNCATFRYGRTILSASPGEGINNSDVDLIEYQGRVFGVYLDGDQQTWGDLCRWEYAGTLVEMFAAYLP